MPSEYQVLGAQIPAAHREWCGNHWRKMGRLLKRVFPGQKWPYSTVPSQVLPSFDDGHIQVSQSKMVPWIFLVCPPCLLLFHPSEESKANSCSLRSPGFGWDWVIFAPRSWCRMRIPLLRHWCCGWCLPQVKALSFPCSAIQTQQEGIRTTTHPCKLSTWIPPETIPTCAIPTSPCTPH